MDSLKLKAVYGLAQMAYSAILRDLLVKCVEATDNDYDDYTVNLCDLLFQFKE